MGVSADEDEARGWGGGGCWGWDCNSVTGDQVFTLWQNIHKVGFYKWEIKIRPDLIIHPRKNYTENNPGANKLKIGSTERSFISMKSS